MPGTIRISHGIMVTMKVIKEAVLSPRTAPDVLRASPICDKPVSVLVCLSTVKVRMTGIFSVSLARILRCAVSESS